MNFIVSTSTLLKQLKSISGVLSSNNTIPILDNFLFEIVPGQLVVHASDMETTVTTSLKVESKDAGSIAIPARPLIDTLSNFPEQPLTFSIDTKVYGIKIITDNGEYKLTGHNGEEYPRVPKIEASSSIVIKTDVVASAINKTLFATGNDDLRPVMNGVFCQFSESETLFVATDAHKLVKYRRTDSKAGHPASFILPKKPLNLLKANVGSEGEVQIEFNESNAIFTFGDIVLMCRLVDGKYPNYEAVIPKENPNVLTIDRAQFLSSIKRVSIFANKSTHQIKLHIAGSELSISAEDLDFNNESKERLTCSFDGDDMEIGFNARFLMEMLSNMESSEVKIQMSIPSRAGLLVPANNENENEDILMLVMPVMLNA
jgi:DNA polymerase-3 subunit beta